MFLQQTVSPWFAIHRVSQGTMILLTIAVCFLPLLYQPQEALADPVTAAIIIGTITLTFIKVIVTLLKALPKSVSCYENAFYFYQVS